MPRLELGERQVLTAAPEVYDWGWTKQVDASAATDEKGRALRLVEVEDDYHLECQIGRYRSGLYLTIPSQAELDKLVEYGFVTVAEGSAA